MLILSRKLNESIVIDGRIIVKVLRIDKDTVKWQKVIEWAKLKDKIKEK